MKSVTLKGLGSTFAEAAVSAALVQYYEYRMDTKKYFARDSHENLRKVVYITSQNPNGNWTTQIAWNMSDMRN